MDTKELLTSGIIERYFLGELSKEEESMVLQKKAADPEIKSYFEKTESKFIQLGLENGIQPSLQVTDQILQSIHTKNGTDSSSYPFKTWFGIAAAIALLFGLFSLWNFNKIENLENEIVRLNQEREYLNNEIEDYSKSLSNTEDWLAYIENPAVSKLVLTGNEKLPEATAITYVNHEEKKVIADIKGMPELDADKDFQLWADVDGEMIDMGVLPEKETVVTMKYIENASSYNITIEPAGGSDHPTVSQLISFATLPTL